MCVSDYKLPNYSYTLRFVCPNGCDIEDLQSKIRLETAFTFNYLTLPHDQNVDLYIDSFSGSSAVVAASIEYNTNNQIIMHTSITGDHHLTVNDKNLNNTITHRLNINEYPHAILPISGGLLTDVLSFKGYTMDDPASFFADNNAMLGSISLDLYNTRTIAWPVILASDAKDIQAYIPTNTTIGLSGAVCSPDIVQAPTDLTHSYSGVVKAFRIGSPCTNTSLTFNIPVAIRVDLGISPEQIYAIVSQDGENWEYVSINMIGDTIAEIQTSHFSLFQILASDPLLNDREEGGENEQSDLDTNPSTGPSGGKPLSIKNITKDTIDNAADQKTITNPETLDCSNNRYNVAYAFGFRYDITTMSHCSKADMDGILIRKHAAKMISNYAMHVLGRVPDVSKVCLFSDMQSESSEMQHYAVLACQLGIMGLEADGITPATVFNPNRPLDKAQFGTMLSRLLYGSRYDNNDGSRYWVGHIDILQNNNIITVTNDLFQPLKRAFALLMLLRTQ